MECIFILSVGTLFLWITKYSSTDSLHHLNLTKVPLNISVALTGLHFPESSSFGCIARAMLIISTKVSISFHFNCHGPSLDDDKAPAMGHRSSLGGNFPVTMPTATPATTSITKLHMVAIGTHNLLFESHCIQDFDTLADAELLWDVCGVGAEKRQRD